MRVWEWPLAITDSQTIEMPLGAKILTVQIQGEVPVMYALCNKKLATRRRRKIAIHGTGNPMPDEPGVYIATFQLHEGLLVFHVFEEE